MLLFFLSLFLLFYALDQASFYALTLEKLINIPNLSIEHCNHHSPYHIPRVPHLDPALDHRLTHNAVHSVRRP